MFEAMRVPVGDAAAFMARWPVVPPQFASWGEGGAVPMAGCAEAIGEDHWAEGFAAGRAEAEGDLAREADAMDALLLALDRLAPMPGAVLAERLAREVRALLVELVGTAALDEDLLVARCGALADLAGSGAAVLHAHPDDAALLMAARPSMTIIADDRLPRGELLLIDGAGEAGAGPRTMLADWAATAGDTPC